MAQDQNHGQFLPFAGGAGRPARHQKQYPLHIGLFAITFATCMLAGTAWSGEKDYLNILTWHEGLTYAILILTCLSAHEFGHYFAAKFHKVDATLPFYIPFPIIPAIVPISFGTMGAVIKMRSPIPSRKALFDIGAAGPIAGFVVCLSFLIYGLMALPAFEHIYTIHPEYLTANITTIPKYGLLFGDNIMYSVMSSIFANPNGWLPPMNEIYHYPFLNVGWFGLFVTSLNMLPIGQLDGGHITYAMFGKLHARIARVAWWIILVIGSSALLEMLYITLDTNWAGSFVQIIKDMIFPTLSWLKGNVPFVFQGWFGWLVWAFITKVFIKLDHPPVVQNDKLDRRRMAIGWVALFILLSSFSLNGLYFAG